MYVVTKTGITPHHLYTQMNELLDVPAKNDSNKANNKAIDNAPPSLHGKPNILEFLSSGSILNEIIPARENIIDNSQHTPINRINVVDSFDTVHSG